MINIGTGGPTAFGRSVIPVLDPPIIQSAPRWPSRHGNIAATVAGGTVAHGRARSARVPVDAAKIGIIVYLDFVFVGNVAGIGINVNGGKLRRAVNYVGRVARAFNPEGSGADGAVLLTDA